MEMDMGLVTPSSAMGVLGQWPEVAVRLVVSLMLRPWPP
jgi:hypothetical protein